MKLHETETLTRTWLPLRREWFPTLARTRVPGGWLYTTLDYVETGNRIDVVKGTAFVPLHAEGDEPAER